MNTQTALQRTAALLTVGAAIVHLGVAGEHFQEWWLGGAFFVVSGVAQLAWAVRLWLRPASRLLLQAGAFGSALLILLWLASRSTGLPIGPEAGTPEPIGLADSFTVALEALSAGAAGLASAGLASAAIGGRRVGARTAAVVTGAVAALVVAVSGTALAAPTPGHDHQALAAAETAAGSDPAPSGHTHGSGDHPAIPNLPDTSSATPEQTKTAQGFLDKTKAATAAYADVAAAKAAGFDVQAAWDRRQALLAKAGRKGAAGVGLVHVPNRANRTDGRVLDSSAPETLIYAHGRDGKFTLVGVMYTAERRQPPASYLPYLRWHDHEFCRGGGLGRLRPVDGACPAGTTATHTGSMAHLWFVPDLAEAYAVKAPRKALLATYPGLA